MEEKLISHALVDSVSLPTVPAGTLEGKIVGRVSLLGELGAEAARGGGEAFICISKTFFLFKG